MEKIWDLAIQATDNVAQNTVLPNKTFSTAGKDNMTILPGKNLNHCPYLRPKNLSNLLTLYM
jgi:hypothetical protein